MKYTKLALSVLILAGILSLASCSDDNSVKTKEDDVNGNIEVADTAAVFLIQSSYVALVEQSEPIESSILKAWLKENGEFVAPEFAKCNGENMVEFGGSKGQYQYSTPYYAPDFNVEIGGYLGGTLAFTASHNRIIRFTNITAGDTIRKNNFKISYTGVDPNTELRVMVSSPFGSVLKRISTTASTGTVTFAAEELASPYREAAIVFLQDRDELSTYKNKMILKRFSSYACIECYIVSE